MKKDLLFLFAIGLTAATIPSIYGQSLTNMVTSFDGDKVIITYDLEGPDPTQKYKVFFYSSHDFSSFNFFKPYLSGL